MPRYFPARLILASLLSCLALLPLIPARAQGDPTAAARGVLTRTVGPAMAGKIDLRLTAAERGGAGDQYLYQAAQGTLHIQGTSTAALCRGFYDYLRAQKLGTVGWAGPRLRVPAAWPDALPTTGRTPFLVRHAYNVVTFGYTTPYWDWARWERELDLLALHGYNMVMAPVATEAIATRVWQQYGLTEEEIAAFYTGPAHLPWQRMGNIQGVGGNLSPAWHRDQIALQKQLLARMAELGIDPVIQAFAGFVPPGMKRIHPEVEYHATLWNGGFPESQRPIVMLPDTPLWKEILGRFIGEWKNEFGEARYWLVDSFNELQLPKTNESPEALLARYGRTTHTAIRAADPDAIWVLQGWMFNYQRNIWNAGTVKAFVESVPKYDLFILDYANDYNPNWDDFSAFHGRPWAMGFVPNMGGKTAYTGKMDLYANQAANTITDPRQGNLIGFTTSGEGLENNEVIYELMVDSSWSTRPINLDQWLPAYAANRYGTDDATLAKAWDILRRGTYSKFNDHPTFSWQKVAGLGKGSAIPDQSFFDATKTFLSQATRFGDEPNYRDDAVELAALALGRRADDWLAAGQAAFDMGDADGLKLCAAEACKLLLQADHLLESHATHRLARWIELARNRDGSNADKDAWETNARQILTVWGPPVNDYACRVWSGLIRDFYVPRLRARIDAMTGGKPFKQRAFEAAWVNAKGVSPIQPLAQPAIQAAKWIDEALAKQPPNTGGTTVGEVIASWDPSMVATTWKTVEWPISSDLLQRLGGVRFLYTSGNHRLDMRSVAIVADGNVVAQDTHQGFTGSQHQHNIFRLNVPAGTTANNTCVLRAEIRSDGGTDSRGKVLLMPRK